MLSSDGLAAAPPLRLHLRQTTHIDRDTCIYRDMSSSSFFFSFSFFKMIKKKIVFATLDDYFITHPHILLFIMPLSFKFIVFDIFLHFSRFVFSYASISFTTAKISNCCLPRNQYNHPNSYI